MPRILISYRREDSAPSAAWLYECLVEHFPRTDVFVDIDTIKPGEDFTRIIPERVQACDVLLALIGRNWLSVADSAGRPRLDDPQDWVRLEIAAALQRGIRVVPVLSGGAKLPEAGQLPPDLEPLRNRQAVSLSDEHFRRDAGDLARSLRSVGGRGLAVRLVRAGRKPILAVAAVLLVIAASFAAYVSSWRTAPNKPNATKATKTTVPPVKAEPGPGKLNPGDGLMYVFIPPGEFEMGCVPGNTGCADDEKPRHRVRITRGFWLSQTEVTQGAYQRVMGKKPPSRYQGSDRPVENATWNEAVRYCAAVGGRLPTEAEWEYAARAGIPSARFPWGNAIEGKNARYAVSREEGTAKVGSYSPNAFRLCDMGGNVWEWVADWYSNRYYGSSPASDPQGPRTGKMRVARGGSWFNGPDYLRVSHRLSRSPESRSPDLGFRCVQVEFGEDGKQPF